MGLCATVSAYETMYRAYLSTDEVARLHVAKTIIGYPSLSSHEVGPTEKRGCTIFASLSFCRNIHANSHVDYGMSQGMVALHQPGVKYTYRQEPLA